MERGRVSRAIPMLQTRVVVVINDRCSEEFASATSVIDKLHDARYQALWLSLYRIERHTYVAYTSIHCIVVGIYSVGK